MEKEIKEKIADALKRKEVSLPCPRCAKGNFDIIGYGSIPLNSDPNVTKVGGTIIPTVIIACVNCGFCTEHALGPLGLMSILKK